LSRARIALLICLLQVLTFSHPTVGASKTLVTIAYQGPLTGPEAPTGIAQFDAVSYAVTKFNAASAAYQVKVIPVDDQGDPAIAVKVAPGISKNPQIIGMVGPAYSSATIASLPFYKAGGLPLISPTAIRATLTDPASEQFGGPVFHRIAIPDSSIGLTLAIKATAGTSNPKVFIIDDQSSYAVPLAEYVMTGLKKVAGAAIVGTSSIQENTTDYSALIAKIKSANTNTVVFTGYYNQAAVFIKQFRDSGSKAIFAAGEGVFYPDYLKLAGTAAEGTRLVSGTSDSLRTFFPKLESDFRKVVGSDSGISAVEAIDATNIFLKCISDGNIKRLTMLSCVKKYQGVSLARDEISFSANGAIFGRNPFQIEVIKSAFYATSVTKDYFWPDFKTKIVEPVEPAGTSVGSSTKKEILCLRGTITKKLRSANPVCPPGYSLKSGV
jgi:branched-chain amino acid transport system substrate-binding protein